MNSRSECIVASYTNWDLNKSSDKLYWEDKKYKNTYAAYNYSWKSICIIINNKNKASTSVGAYFHNNNQLSKWTQKFQIFITIIIWDMPEIVLASHIN